MTMKKFRILKFHKKPILVAKKISKSFDRPVLNQISFNVNKGEIFGILGPNGCGKTTLFSCLLGIYELDGGDFYFVHSNIVICPEKYVLATTTYERPFASVIKYKNIYGVQFHPEKSSNLGEKVFRGFLNI